MEISQNGSKILGREIYCIEKGRENEYWGYVIRVEKNSYRLESGRVAKKSTCNLKWKWGNKIHSLTAQDRKTLCNSEFVKDEETDEVFIKPRKIKTKRKTTNYSYLYKTSYEEDMAFL